MDLVLLAALGVGGASVLGALLGFLFKKSSHKFNDAVLSFAAGVMLFAAVVGLIMPSLEYGGGTALIISVLGILCGAFCINLIDKVVPHLHRIAGNDIENHPERQGQLDKVLLFVIAIAIHNLPEGLAVGVGFGAEDKSQALMIAGGIALQNIPEVMVLIGPMLSVGMSRGRTFIIALVTGLIEVVGALLGYFAVSVSEAVLPFALAFAGGTMLYIISDEMIPETHSHGNERVSTYSLIFGFLVMMCFDVLL